MRLTLYIANGTKSAIFFMLCQRQSPGMTASRKLGVWIPKSLCQIITRAPDRAWRWPECEVEVADFFATREKIAERQEHIRKHHVKPSNK